MLGRSVLALTLLAGTAPAFGATIVVDSTADDLDPEGGNGNCTLREAVLAANYDVPVDGCPRGNGADTILVPPGTYRLSREGFGEDAGLVGDLDLTDAVVIQGSGLGGPGGATVIDAMGLDRAFHVNPLLVNPYAEVTIRDLAITGGSADFGGAVNTFGRLVVERVVAAGNEAGAGGAFASAFGFSDLTLRDCLVVDNLAVWAAGVQFEGGTGTVERCTFTGNESIVLRSSASRLQSDASAGGRGATGLGGAISLVIDAEVGIVNSTMSGNRAAAGAGLEVETGAATVRHVTMARNVGGTTVLGASRVSLASSLVEGTCDGAPLSQGGNIESPGSTCTLAGPGDLAAVADAKLVALAPNGGIGPTHGLVAGSPAIDAALPAHCPETDQRLVPRPIDGDGTAPTACDVGALELSPSTDDFSLFRDDFESGDLDRWSVGD